MPHEDAPDLTPRTLSKRWLATVMDIATAPEEVHLHPRCILVLDVASRSQIRTGGNRFLWTFADGSLLSATSSGAYAI